jgi:hypothetical protein
MAIIAQAARCQPPALTKPASRARRENSVVCRWSGVMSYCNNISRWRSRNRGDVLRRLHSLLRCQLLNFLIVGVDLGDDGRAVHELVLRLNNRDGLRRSTSAADEQGTATKTKMGRMDIPPREVNASHNPYGQAMKTVLKYYRRRLRGRLALSIDECQY